MFIWQIAQAVYEVIFASVQREIWVDFLAKYLSVLAYVCNQLAVFLLQAVALLLVLFH